MVFCSPPCWELRQAVIHWPLGVAADDIYRGFESMMEIMVLSLFIGGLSCMMTEGGGKACLTETIRRLLSRGGSLSGRAGAVLVSVCNLFTANNTVAILAAGEVARDLSHEAKIDPRRSASLLDIFSCVVQGVIPWGRRFCRLAP